MLTVFLKIIKVFEVLVFILQSLEIYHRVSVNPNVYAIYATYTKMVKAYNYLCLMLHVSQVSEYASVSISAQ